MFPYIATDKRDPLGFTCQQCWNMFVLMPAVLKHVCVDASAHLPTFTTRSNYLNCISPRPTCTNLYDAIFLRGSVSFTPKTALRPLLTLHLLRNSSHLYYSPLSLLSPTLIIPLTHTYHSLTHPYHFPHPPLSLPSPTLITHN